MGGRILQLLAQNTRPDRPTVKVLEYQEMKPFFVAGDSDAA